MSVANYDASSLNHSEILICIQTVGTLQENVLIEAYSKIRKHSKLVIPDAGRTIRFRFEVRLDRPTDTGIRCDQVVEYKLLL